MGYGMPVDRDLPLEFDPQFYRATNPDLAAFDAAALADHYDRFGRAEGRSASPAATREGLVALLPPELSALEIGPFCWPVLKGPNVRYMDVLDQTGLIKRAQEIGASTASSVPIDYVSPNGNLSIIDRKFGVVFSAHCIEHQPDLIFHLGQVSKLLESGGAYFLVIPDKRYCFDYFIAESTIADVIDAHARSPKAHSLKSIIEHRALTTHNDTARHWIGDHGRPRIETDAGASLRYALNEAEKARGGYVDVHAWQFTPESFRLLITALAAHGFSRLTVSRVYQSVRDRSEFCAILTS